MAQSSPAKRNWHKENRERSLSRMRDYQRKHSKRLSARSRAYYIKKRDEARANGKIDNISFSTRKSQAKKRGLEFTLTPEMIMVPQMCPVLGIKLDYSDFDHTPSIDRIDNSKGYIPDNIAVISLRANRLKADLTIETLELLLAYMKKVGG